MIQAVMIPRGIVPVTKSRDNGKFRSCLDSIFLFDDSQHLISL